MQSWGTEPSAGVVAILIALAGVLLIVRTWSGPGTKLIVTPVVVPVAAGVNPNGGDQSADQQAAASRADSRTVIPDMRIDLNQADEFALQSVPSIGPVLAGRIVEERAVAGPFSSMGQLAERVKGIGPKTIRKIEQYVTLSHPIDESTMNTPDPGTSDGG